MAYNYRIEYVTTSRRDIVKGLKFPMGNNEGGYFSSSFDKQAILEGLIQGIKTQKGERVMYPDFGTTTRRRVFEPITDSAIKDIKQEVQELISRYFPRVELKSLRVGSNVSGNGVDSGDAITIQATVWFKDQPSEEETINVVVNR